MQSDGRDGSPPSDWDDANDYFAEVAAAADAVPRRREVPVYHVPTLRPVAELGADDDEHAPVLGKRYGALEEELLLAGGGAMRPGPTGSMVLIETLREVLPWMEPAIGALERQLRIALWAGRPWLSFRPLCLAGPPGVGKSYLAREVGRIAGVGGATLDLGGMHDAAALVPVSQGWSNMKPCWPAQMMASLRIANPILVVDELEKAGGSRRHGDPQRALLSMLEPSTARVFYDTCLMAKVDLSAVNWICTVNDAGAIPRPLASRLEVVEVPRPDPGHFDLIVRRLIDGMAKRWAVPRAVMPDLPAADEAVLRARFARGRSLRVLARGLEDALAGAVSLPRRLVH